MIATDRGFQRVALLQDLDAQGCGYVIRVKGDAYVEVGNYSGKLPEYPLAIGQCFKLSKVTDLKTQR